MPPMHALQGPPWFESLRQLIREDRGVRSLVERFLRHHPRGRMVAVTVALVALESRNDDERALGSDHRRCRGARGRCPTSPAFRRGAWRTRSRRPFRNTGGPRRSIDPPAAVRRCESGRARRTVRAERIVARLSAGERQQRHLRPLARLSIVSTPPCSSSGCAVVCRTLAVVRSLISFARRRPPPGPPADSESLRVPRWPAPPQEMPSVSGEKARIRRIAASSLARPDVWFPSHGHW